MHEMCDNAPMLKMRKCETIEHSEHAKIWNTDVWNVREGDHQNNFKTHTYEIFWRVDNAGNEHMELWSKQTMNMLYMRICRNTWIFKLLHVRTHEHI